MPVRQTLAKTRHVTAAPAGLARQPAQYARVARCFFLTGWITFQQDPYNSLDAAVPLRIQTRQSKTLQAELVACSGYGAPPPLNVRRMLCPMFNTRYCTY